MLDVFKSDAFSLFQLTASINKLPYVPGRIGELGLFKEEGVSSLSVMIEEQQGVLYLIPTAARGTMPNMAGSQQRKARVFKIPHLPFNTAVMADEVQGVRAFGSEDSAETVTQKVNDKLEKMRQSHEFTHEWHRVGALKGLILDADGSSTIYDLFDEFDLTQDEINFDFSDDDLDVKAKCIELKRTVEDALGGTTHTGVHVFCGDDFFDALVGHPKVENAFERFSAGAFYHEDQRPGFEYPKGVTWENYRGKVGATKFFDDEEGYAHPVGVPDLFSHYMGPANFIEAVNTIGQKIYAKQEEMRFGVGIELHTQSNPLLICNRPQCLVKLTMDAESA